VAEVSKLLPSKQRFKSSSMYLQLHGHNGTSTSPSLVKSEMPRFGIYININIIIIIKIIIIIYICLGSYVSNQ
jgi:hypothetical protein